MEKKIRLVTILSISQDVVIKVFYNANDEVMDKNQFENVCLQESEKYLFFLYSYTAIILDTIFFLLKYSLFTILY